MTYGIQRIPAAQHLKALRLLRHLFSQQGCELRQCRYPHCSDGQLRHEEIVAEASLNGQTNLQLAAAKWDGVETVQKIMPYPPRSHGKSAGLEIISRWSVLQAMKFRLSSWLTS